MTEPRPKVRRSERAWLLAGTAVTLVWTVRAALAAFTPDNPNPYVTPLAVLVTLLAVLVPLVRSGRYGRSRWADATLALGSVLVLSGGVVQALPPGGDFRRAALLGHLVAGLLVLLPVHLYLFGHLRDAVRRRPVALVRGGAAAIALLLGSTWTGTAIAVLQAREMEPLATPHMLLSWGAVALVASHAVLGRRVLARREAPEPVRRRFAVGAGLPAVLLLVAAGAYALRSPDPAPHEPLVAREGPPLSNLGQTEAPSRHPANWAPATCSGPGGYCHIDNVTQWKRSTHARSANPAYRAVLARLEETRPGKSRYCASCHEPRFALTGEGPIPGAGPAGRVEFAPRGVLGEPVTDGATGRPALLPPTGPAELAEGVGCQVCHRGAFQERGTASYRVVSTPTDLVRTAAIPFFNFPMILADLDLHRRQVAEGAERAGPALCAACHVHHVPDALHPGIPGLEAADKLGPWRASRYATGTEEERQACIDCHMPRTYGPIDPTWTRSHAFPSGNTGVPWLLDMPERVAEAEAFLRDRVELTGLCEPVPGVEGAVLCRARVTNTGVGHEFPAGPRDIEETWLSAELRRGGEAVAALGEVPDDTPSPPGGTPLLDWTLVLRDEAGERLDLHEFWLAAEVEGRAPLGPGETVEAELGFEGGRADTVRFRLLRRRYNPRFARAAFGEDTEPAPVTELARVDVPVPRAAP